MPDLVTHRQGVCTGCKGRPCAVAIEDGSQLRNERIAVRGTNSTDTDQDDVIVPIGCKNLAERTTHLHTRIVPSVSLPDGEEGSED